MQVHTTTMMNPRQLLSETEKKPPRESEKKEGRVICGSKDNNKKNETPFP
jgi:hypothetical protein